MNTLEQIEELLSVQVGLKVAGTDIDAKVLAGNLGFEAKSTELNPITEYFEIVIRIPNTYPVDLPEVYEVGGVIDDSYGHLFVDGRSCLGAPVDLRRIFDRKPTLLGFVNNIVIPYFYGYCHWKSCGRHPFGELAHEGEGIVQYYCEQLSLKDKVSALSVLCFLSLHGYRGHHICPCGSGLKVRHCHSRELFDLVQHHTPQTLRTEWYFALRYCEKQSAEGKLQFTDKLRREIQLIQEKCRSKQPRRKFLDRP